MWTISSMAAAMLLISSVAAQEFPVQNQNEIPQQPQGLQFPGPSPFSFQLAQPAEQMIESSLQPGGLAAGLSDSVMDTSAPAHDSLLQFLQRPGLAQERQVEEIFRQQQAQHQQFNLPQEGQGPQQGSQDEPLMSSEPDQTHMRYQQSQPNPAFSVSENQEEEPSRASSGGYPGPSELRREEVHTWQDFHADPLGASQNSQNSNQQELGNNNFHPIQYQPGQLSNYAFLPPPPNFKIPNSNVDQSEDAPEPVPPAPPVRQSKKISNGRKKKAKASSKPVAQSGKTRPRGDVRLAEEQQESNYDYIESPSDIEVYRVPVGYPQDGAQTRQRRKKPKKSSAAAGTNTNVLYYEDPRDIANINVLKDLNKDREEMTLSIAPSSKRPQVSSRRRKPSKQEPKRTPKPQRRPTPVPEYIYDYVEEEEDMTSAELPQQQPMQKLRPKLVHQRDQRVKSQAEMDSEFLLGKFLPELLAFQRNSGYAAAFYQNMFAGMAPPVMGGMQAPPPMFPMMLPAPSPTAPTTTTTAEAPTTTESPPPAETVSETPLTDSGNAAIVGSISYDFSVPRTEEPVAPPPPTPEVYKSEYYKSALFLPSQVAELFDQQQQRHLVPTQLPASPAPPTTVPPPAFVPTQISYVISPQPQRQRPHFEIQPSSGYHYRDREQSYSVDPVVSPIHPTAPPKKTVHHGTMSPLRHLAQLSKYFYPKHLLPHRPPGSMYGTAAPPPPPSQAPPVKVIQSIRSQPLYLQQSLQHPEGFNINLKNPPPVLYSPPPGNGPLLPIRIPPHQFVQSPPPKLPGLPAHLVPLTSAQAHGMLNNPLLLPQDPMHRLQLQEALQLVSRFTAVQSARLNGFQSPNVDGPLVPVSAPQALSYLPVAGRQQSPQYMMGQMAHGSEVKPVVVLPPPVQNLKSDSDSAVGDSNQVNVIAVPTTEGGATTESNANSSTEATTSTTVGTTTTEGASSAGATTASSS